MPPVFGPSSPSSARLWSWAVGKSLRGLAVAQRVQGNLRAFEQFLDDDGGARPAEGLLGQNFINGTVRFATVRQIRTPLPRARPSAFTAQMPFSFAANFLADGDIGKSAGAGSGDAVLFHEILRKDLGGLELRRLVVRPPDAQAVFLKQIHDAEGEGIIRANDRQISTFFQRKGEEPRGNPPRRY